MAYEPKPAGPNNLRELFHYLWNNLKELGALVDGETGTDPDPDPTPVPIPPAAHNHFHPNILARSQPDAHPISAITGLVAEQAAQDVAIFANTKVFFQPTQPTDLESSAGDIWFKEGYN